MNILVCVKQVPDDYVEIRLNGAGKPATAGVEIVNNAFDTYALELAARYKEANGGSVTVLTLGRDGAQNGLKNLLAVGADKAYLVTPPEGDTDENGVAAWLARAIQKCRELDGAPYDMILCGKESTDEISGQVGAMLAEKLGLPFVSGVIEVESVDSGLSAKQETESGYVRYEVAAPAVFTIARPGYDPRYPSIKNKLAARKAVIPVISAQDAGLEAQPARVTCLSYTEPPRRQAGVRVQEKEAAGAAARAVALMAEAKVL